MIKWIDIKDELPKDKITKEMKCRGIYPKYLVCFENEYICESMYVPILKKFSTVNTNFQPTHWAKINLPKRK